MTSKELPEKELTFKDYFVPLTTTKAIHFIIIIGIVVYANALFNGFIADDNGQILDNQVVHSIGNFFTFFISGSFSGGGSTGAGIYYKPVFSIVLSGIYSLFGPVPFFFHLTQLALHIINTSLIFLLFSKFIKNYLAIFFALIFLVHPINAESVIYISDMQEMLFFFFGITGLFFSTQKNHSIRSIILVHIFLLLALLSKETGILFVIMTMFYTYLFNKKQIKFFILASTIVIGVYSLMRFVVAGIYFNKDILNPIMEATILERLQTIPAIISYYLTTFFFPKDLLFNQQFVIKQLNASDFWIPFFVCFLFFAVLILLAIGIAKRKKEYKKIMVFFNVWFFLGILLHIQLFPLDATVADRWFYFPIVGLLGILGFSMEYILAKYSFPKRNYIFLTLTILLIIILSIRTIERNTNWRDPISLYTHDLPLMRANFSIENALAYEYARINDLDKALMHANQSVEIYPTFVNLTNLGAAYDRVGDKEKAKEFFTKAIEKENNFYLAYENMTLLLIKHYSVNEARDFMIEATKIFPTNKKMWFYRVVAEYRAGNQENALHAAERYYLLSQNQESYDIYLRLQNKQPLNIEIK